MSSRLPDGMDVIFPDREWKMKPEVAQALRTECLNILVFGWVGSGKSSLLNTLDSLYSMTVVKKDFAVGSGETHKTVSILKCVDCCS